jgi:hypothetical protein
MVRTFAVSVLVLLALTKPVLAEERRPDALVAPSPAVAAAWAKESGSSSGAVRTLFVSYAAVQGLDMVSTMRARNRGAVEANPFMQGNYARGMAVKAAFGAVTMLAVRGIEKKSRKAAIITMIAANVGTAAVIANNLRNAKQLR